MRTKIIVALLLAVMLVCSVSALAAASSQQMRELTILWYNRIATGIDPYNSDYARQYYQACTNDSGYTPEEVDWARSQAVMYYNQNQNPGLIPAPLTAPELGDDSIPLSLLAGLAALALGGAVFAHRRCKQC